ESFLGLDIGGANLKCADLSGRTHSLAFPLWQRPTDLAAVLAQLLAPFPHARHIAVTMTGELADCFSDVAQGVRHIVEHTDQAIRTQRPNARPAFFYSLDGSFVSARQANQHPDPLAASNWHALATVVASAIDRPTLLIDIGSTTTDLTALDPGNLRTRSRADFDRLQTGELVYVGVERTPLCALVDTLPVDGKNVPVMKELFATTDDCALLTGLTRESPFDCQTADGRPRTIVAARGRMAKMVGLDHRSFSLEQARLAAEACLRAMVANIERAAAFVASDIPQWILGGHGGMLLQRWGTLPITTFALSEILLPLCDQEGAGLRHPGESITRNPRRRSLAGEPQPASASAADVAISRVAPAFAAAYLLARETCIASLK
ncbi:MAG: hydantoinase/oxoprolinase family protein, partial [Pirellulaceae bacterium]